MQQLSVICTAPGTPSRKAMAIDELRKLDTSEARQALLSLADSSDERVAILAISAVGRTEGTAARNKLKAIVESGSRSDSARAAALTAFCARERKAERSWGSNRSWVETHTASNSRLAAQAALLETKFWGEESDDE